MLRQCEGGVLLLRVPDFSRKLGRMRACVLRQVRRVRHARAVLRRAPAWSCPDQIPIQTPAYVFDGALSETAGGRLVVNEERREEKNQERTRLVQARHGVLAIAKVLSNPVKRRSDSKWKRACKAERTKIIEVK
jgi:hypothetical protein